MKVLVITVFIILEYFKLLDCQLQSPCPEVFQYINEGNERYGLVKYSNAQPNQDYMIEVEMSVKGNLPSVSFIMTKPFCL